MIDRADLATLETEVRELIGEEVAKFWTQARVYRAINAEVMRLCRKVIDLDSGYLEAEYTVTPTTSTITLPANLYIIRNIEVYRDMAWQALRWIDDHAKGQYAVLSTAGAQALAVRFVANTLVLEPVLGSISSIRIQYARIPASLLACTLDSGSATTAVLPSGSAIDDVYIGDRFIILDGTGVGQISTVTDYVASTKTLTIASGATLDSTTVISFLLPEPLAKWPDLVAMGAALRLLPRNRDDNRSQMLRGDYERDLGDMMSALAQRQTDQPARVNFIPDGDED